MAGNFPISRMSQCDVEAYGIRILVWVVRGAMAASSYKCVLCCLVRDSRGRLCCVTDGRRPAAAPGARLGIGSVLHGERSIGRFARFMVFTGRPGALPEGVRGDPRFPPMAPLGGLFATQRRHWGETERGRCDRYMANARFGRSAGTPPMPETTRFVRTRHARKPAT